MASGKYDIYVEAGANWFIYLKLSNPNGTLFDLTNYTGSASFTDGTVLTVIFDTDRTTGRLTISLTSSETAVLSGVGQYNFELTKSGVVSRVIEGNYEVSEDVT